MNSKYDDSERCPCHSGVSYEACCRPFHLGEYPSTALKLMRSRYAAYALKLPDYLMHTTHPANPNFCFDAIEWRQKIVKFSALKEFKGLEILEFQDGDRFAAVTFVAHLMQGEKDVSFCEKSYFEKVRGKWLYLNGRISSGCTPNFVSKTALRILPFAYYGDPILREVAAPILEITQELHQLVEDMTQTMDAWEGYGLAAPQVHHRIQLFIIRKPVEVKGKIELGEVKVFINPKVSMPSIETWKVSEDCISIPTIYAEVERPKEITIEYSDLSGRQVKERASGWEARVILHENDHLNGVLYLDHLDEKTRNALEPALQHLQQRVQEALN